MMTIPSKYLQIVFITVLSILAIPLIAMQFTEQVQWTIGDFLVGGLMLTAVGFGIAFIMHKGGESNRKYYIIGAIVLFFLLLWAVLAVGIIS